LLEAVEEVLIDPDLLDTMKRVFFRSTLFSKAVTWAGSVESSTWRSGNPLIAPKVARITSGPRLDPPIPSNATWEKPALLAASEMSVKRWRWAS
jgi:hypothetical protein